MIRRTVDHVQRIVEGWQADTRHALWSYSQFIEQQRRFVQRERQRILTDAAPPTVASDATAGLEKRIALQAIDQCWAEHLATVAEIRDGIHLVTIGGLSPLEEFQKAVATSFMECWESRDRYRQSHEETLRGPAATWTYLIDEDIYDDPLASALSSRHHTGFAAGAAFTGPLLMLWALTRRFRRA